jgi:hypothetical protein
MWNKPRAIPVKINASAFTGDASNAVAACTAIQERAETSRDKGDLQ